MKDLLAKNLNTSQIEAALYTNGPLIIFAGAGTGKTRVITHRIAYLLSLGIDPRSILAVTFTNKAAAEMKKRVIDLVPHLGSRIWVSTFHAFCAYFLSVEATKINLNTDFLIYDFIEQKNVIKDCMKELNLDEKKIRISSIVDKISRAKDDLKSPSDMANESENTHSYSKTLLTQIYLLYQKKLEKAGALDFGDLIMRTVSALRQYPALLEYYQEKYKYIMVDEYQDTNHAQYMLIKLLASKHRNVCVVGDDDQCLPQGTSILTSNGYKKVETVSQNDTLISAAGYGKTTLSKIENIKRRKYKNLIVKIKTKSGKIITATPNHIAFTKLNPSPKMYYVYLTYKENTGYRIGQSKGIHIEIDKTTNSLIIKSTKKYKESADKIWILKVFKDKTFVS
jgi:DNA helicase-2/ATP-dependent DNA helicase PcrA